MAITQTRPKRTVSGGRYKSYRKKRIYEIARAPTSTKIGKTQTKQNDEALKMLVRFLKVRAKDWSQESAHRLLVVVAHG